MIRHMVLFTLHDGVSADDPRVRRAVAAENALPERIPAARTWTFAGNPTGRADAADFVGTGDFESADELSAFLGHPAHREAGRLWGEVAGWIVADLEIGEGAG